MLVLTEEERKKCKKMLVWNDDEENAVERIVFIAMLCNNKEE